MPAQPLFALVGKTTWHARQAALAVDVDWQQRPGGGLGSRGIEAELAASVCSQPGHVFHEIGDVDVAESKCRLVEVWYRAPCLAHATMESMNCTAQVRDARMAGVPSEAVKVHVTLLGVGFGRRLAVDYVAQAVRIAMDCGGVPVQLIWPREEDQSHDFYRPMQVAMLRAVIDNDGHGASLRIKSAGDAISPRWLARALPALSGPGDTPDKTTAEGLFDLPSAFRARRMEHVATRTAVPIGFWRSVGHSHNAFFSESFIDEPAAAAGRDPVEFRLALLAHAPRHWAVLNLVAEKSGWGATLAAGRTRASRSTTRSHRLWRRWRNFRCRAARRGCTVINPDIVAQQMEGSVVFALSAALHGRIDTEQGVVQQTYFASYPLVNLARACCRDLASAKPASARGRGRARCASAGARSGERTVRTHWEAAAVTAAGRLAAQKRRWPGLRLPENPCHNRRLS